MIEDESNHDEYLTAAELQALVFLDSRQFGFLKLNDSENAKKKAVIQKAIRCMETALLDHETKTGARAANTTRSIKQPQIKCDVDAEVDEVSSVSTQQCEETAQKQNCFTTTDTQQQHEEQEKLASTVIKSEHLCEISTDVAAGDGVEPADVKPDRMELDRQLDQQQQQTAVTAPRDPAALAVVTGDDLESRDHTMDTVVDGDKTVVSGGVEMMEVDGDESRGNCDDDDGGISPIDPRIYCTLGHFWLLLEKFDKSLSAYQNYKRLCSLHWQDAAFLYGYGLTLLHFNAIKKACRVLLCVLYTDPAFACANEVHLRLALIYKARREFLLSRKRFQLVLNDSAVCSLSRQQIDFHIAHLHEVCDRISSARDRYEALLSPQPASTQPSPSPSSPPSPTSDPLPLREHVCRQLSWLLHRQRHQLSAIQLLQRALESAPRSPQTLYLLGRCYSSLGKVHEAFQAYKQSVVFSEASADTWCSIGVLYQQHSQCMDALQAYVSAVQLNKHHSAAWSNLAVLFESSSQPRDALACYTNSLGQSPDNSSPSAATPSPPGHLTSPASPTGDSLSTEPEQWIQQRVRLLKQQLSTSPFNTSAALYNRPSRLPSIEEAWNKNTTTEMTRETQKLQSSNMQNKQRVFGMMANTPQPPPYPGSVMPVNGVASAAKRLKTEEGDYRVLSSGGYHSSTAPIPANQQQYRQQQQQQQQPPQLVSPAAVSETDVETMTNQLLTRKDLAASLAEDLIRQFAQSGELGLEELTTVNPPHSNQQNHSLTAPGSVTSSTPAVASADCDDPTGTASGQVTVRITRPPDLSVQDLRPMSAKVDPVQRLNPVTSSALKSLTPPTTNANAASTAVADVKPAISTTTSSSSSSCPASSPPTSASASCRLHLGLSAEELASVAREGDWRRVSNPVLLPPGAPPPLPAPPPRTRLRRDQLLQQTPSVFVENKRDAYSPNLFDFCLKNPIAVVRGMAAALKLDLGLFSTKTLVEANADHPVEIRTQVCQSSDENWDATFTRRVWGCLSSRSHTTVAKYAQYQAASFTDSLREEQDTKQPVQLATVHRDSDSDSRDSFSKYQRTGNRRGHKTIRFGTNVDLSDEGKWRSQLLELNKLPPFCRVVSACNMLSHVGHPILGMNTVQLYMKVPGSRTPGHQENNNFCALNINIGPGDCEWFGVPASYWSAVNSLCEKNGVSYLHGSWWPDMEELLDSGVPVYRFMQRPGDLVWVNVGCVHWVQAAGWCNNIAWNVGPLTGRQHCMAVERFEWNKLQRYKSIVPMQHLTWNLARNIRPTEKLMFESVKNALMKSLEQVVMALEFVKECGVDIKFHGRQKDESSHYCGVCDVEVFNVLMVKLNERRHVVHCVDCARRQSASLAGFVCLEEFKLDELFSVYDSFQLVNPPASGGSTTASLSSTHSNQLQNEKVGESHPTPMQTQTSSTTTTTHPAAVGVKNSGNNVSGVVLPTAAVSAQVAS